MHEWYYYSVKTLNLIKTPSIDQVPYLLNIIKLDRLKNDTKEKHPFKYTNEGCHEYTDSPCYIHGSPTHFFKLGCKSAVCGRCVLGF